MHCWNEKQDHRQGLFPLFLNSIFQDQDDFSYFNQRTTINDRVTEIMREAREKFFDEFGGWKVCTQVDDYRDVENVFRRKCCRMQQIEIKQKASAYYMVCYKKNSKYQSNTFYMSKI